MYHLQLSRLLNSLLDSLDGAGVHIPSSSDDTLVGTQRPALGPVEGFTVHVGTYAATLSNEERAAGVIPHFLLVVFTARVLCGNTEVYASFAPCETGVFRLTVHSEGWALNTENLADTLLDPVGRMARFDRFEERERVTRVRRGREREAGIRLLV